MRRGLLVAAVVVLAGCSAVPFGADDRAAAPTDTVTPVPLTDGATPTATVPPEFPPGVNGSGTVDAVALSVAHAEFLRNRTYTWSVRYDRGERRFTSGEFLRRVVVGEDNYTVSQTEPDQESNVSLYVNESGGFLRTVQGNDTRYELLAAPGDPDEYAFATESIRRFLAVPVTVSTVERRGRTYFRLYGAGGEVPDAVTTARATISNYSVTAYVTSEGFVRSLAVDYDRTVDGQQSSVRFRYDYSRVGESAPSSPEWTGSVPRRSTPTPVDPARTPDVTPDANGTAAPDTATSTDSLDG